MAASLLVTLALVLPGSIPKEEPGALAQDHLEGSWDFVSLDIGVGAHSKGNFVLQITGDRLVFRFRDGKLNSTVPCTFDTTACPPRISWAHMHGIYSLNGDTFIMAMSSLVDPWPTGFKAGSGTYVYVFKRLKPGR